MSMPRTLCAAICVAAALPLTSQAHADYNLGFNSLPSAQSWGYGAFGDRAGTPESAIYSLSGGVLHEDTIGLPAGSGGSADYEAYFAPATAIKVDPMLTFDLTVNARVTADGGFGAAYPYGFAFGLILNNRQYLMGLSTTTYAIEGPGGPHDDQGGAYNNTDYHTYTIEGLTDGKFNVLIDGATVRTDIAPFIISPAASPRFYLGDVTGYSDADADVRRFSFVQPAGTSTVPEPGSAALLAGLCIAGVGFVANRRKSAAGRA